MRVLPQNLLVMQVVLDEALTVVSLEALLAVHGKVGDMG